MSTHTPSPRRFIARNPLSSQKPKPKSQSGLRNALKVTPKPDTSTREKPELIYKKFPPAKRFVVTPHRRTQSAEEHGISKGNLDEAQADTRLYTQLTPRPKPPRKFECVESIEEPSQSSPLAPPDVDHGFGIVPSIEHRRPFEDKAQQEQEDQEDGEILFVTEQLNKRRRISPPTSPPSHQPSSPTTPTIPHNSTTHRFLAPPPRTPAPFSAMHTSTTITGVTSATPSAVTPAPSRPSFILPPPPTSSQKPSKPLPEIFSPSRKNQKYVPDGLASTMQGWIIEAANTGHAAQERSIGSVVWGRDREDGVRLKMRVLDISSGKTGEGSGEVQCFPGHFVFLRGKTDIGMYNASRASSTVGDASEVRILLAGQGGARGKDRVRVSVGAVVGIKHPTWDIDVAGETWTVGVDWVVLS